MPKKLVDVFDRGGAKLFTYAIALEDVGCLDAEFRRAHWGRDRADIDAEVGKRKSGRADR